MGKSLSTFQDEVKDELGTDLTGLYSDIDTLIERWLNRGQHRLDWEIRRVANLTWTAGTSSITLPTDFSRWGKYIPGTDDVVLPEGYESEGTYKVKRAEGALYAGSGRFLYWAYPRDITSSVASELPRMGDTALIAFCFYSFWNRIATSRSDFQRYSVLQGQNGVDIDEVRQLARDHYDDFLTGKDDMPRKPSITYYGT